jgi:RNA polymerase sigma-70 factor (ECF subfamily)
LKRSRGGNELKSGTGGASRAAAEFSAWYTACYAQAFRIAYRLLGDRAAAEDAAAEGFARAFASWSRVRDLPHRDAWVMRVTSNLALSTLSRRAAAPPRPMSSIEEDAIANRIALVAALRALPRRQREVIVLRYVAGYPELEVAAALGIAPSSVKTHLKRGMSVLRVDFGGTDGSHEVAL